jgi:hypothetical protein
MKRENPLTNWAKKPRIQRAIEAIQLVLKERGNMARGDFLLRAAVDSLCSQDISSSKAYLEHFLLIAKNVKFEHRAVVSVVLSKLINHQKFKIVVTLLNILNLILGIFKLLGRNLLSCNFLGINVPDKINAQYTSNHDP